MPRLVKHVAEPWFSLMASGIKTVEGRLEKGDFVGLRPGATIVWTNDDLGFPRKAVTKVASVQRYPGFKAYLCGEAVAKALPTVASVEKGLSIYRAFYDATAEKEHGVLATASLNTLPRENDHSRGRSPQNACAALMPSYAGPAP